jgi:hypothetical protein
MVRIFLCVLLLSPLTIRAGTEYFIDYFYIEAGQGDSSGGHAAIGFGENVFHYQYSRGLLKAVRQNRSQFEYQYRFLGNRTIHVSRIAVPKSVYLRLNDYFTRIYVVQNRQLKGLELVREDIALLNRLEATQDQREQDFNFFYRAKGAALFSTPIRRTGTTPDPRLPGSPAFREIVAQNYGSTFLSNRRAQTENALASLRTTEWRGELLSLSPNRFPLLPYSFNERFGDLITNLIAIEVIEQDAPLNQDARIDTNLPEFELNRDQLEILVRFRRDLQQDLLQLLASPRPDWGYPLLVGLARLQVLDDSIRQANLVFLDTFPKSSERVDHEDLHRYRETFLILLTEARNHFEREKEHFFALEGMNEPAYALLEISANRYRELARGVAGKSMRIHRGDLAPSAIAEVPVSVLPRISENRLVEEIRHLDDYASEYSESLEDQYRYHLLIRNCVSEIFQNLELGLSEPTGDGGNAATPNTETLLFSGGAIDHGVLNSIPFVSSKRLRDNFRVQDSHALLSYRQARLKALYAEGNPVGTYFKESNTLTSSAYPWNPDDGIFLFFTDDTVLLRPIFGAFNALAGIGQILVGGLLFPVTGGDALAGGMKGLLSSLPELVFFNIRKGSYRYQSFDQLTEPEVPVYFTE